ncbi:MAG: indole-3-glycerol phosphate synthase TrpC [Desulfobulbaceae bacterium]|uniref:Indole-3-glycerol phosphate synthase n=1 Tax=Candidatus Desulfatifera sulfidica TaxID=2841691 RepID=A0A8J6T9I8_9BACT|nr:indole-3-glycerol phosphate synthase TrpC [Candidatus Desulfatifera sulfidica]
MILDTIVARKKEEVAELKKTGIVLPVSFRDKEIAAPRGFIRALVDYPGVAIIAEAKKASPSKGVICPDFDPVKIARNYEAGGAQAVSVLTDVDFFQGSLLYLLQVREAIALPVLRKDFMIDPLQIEQAAAHGADAVLLMASILDGMQIRDFQACAREFGMDSLVEVHDETELETALKAGAELVGVNNRNLKDFSMDTETTYRLQKLLPPGLPLVAESGLKTRADMERLQAHGVTAALIGESLMRGADGGNTLAGLRGLDTA